MVIFEEMRRAIEATAPDRLGEVAAAMAQAYMAGGLTVAEYEQLDGLLAARRHVAKAMPTQARTLAVVAAQAVPAAAPSLVQGGGAALARAHHRTGSRPRSPESMGRRRRWAASGYVPPKLAAGFTAGEQAVLALVGKEIATKGHCTLAVGHIAALAGVSATTVRRARRQATLVRLVAIEARRVTGFRNDTNRITMASREWAAWLRKRLPRSARADLAIASQIVLSTDVEITSIESSSQFDAGTVAHCRAQSPHPAYGARCMRLARPPTRPRAASGRARLVGEVSYPAAHAAGRTDEGLPRSNG